MTEKGGPGTMKGGTSVFVSPTPVEVPYSVFFTFYQIYAQVALLSGHRTDCKFGGPAHSFYSTIIPEHCVDHDQRVPSPVLASPVLVVTPWFSIHPSETHRDPGGVGRPGCDDCDTVLRRKAAVRNPVSSLRRPRAAARALAND